MSDSWYHTAQWRRLRRVVLNEEPLCRFCQQTGRITPADTVDHIRPHGGDWDLFVDRENLQGLCRMCHDSAKRIQDGGEIAPGCDVNGYPLDNKHLWGRKG